MGGGSGGESTGLGRGEAEVGVVESTAAIGYR